MTKYILKNQQSGALALLDWRPNISMSFLISILVLAIYSLVRADTTTLDSLVLEAMENNQDLQAMGENVDALKAEVPFAGSLQDPVLTVGLANIPLDSFDLDQEAMTQKQIAISQKVPWFGTLDLIEQGAVLKALTLESRLKARRLAIIKQVRQNWYDLSFTEKSLYVNNTMQSMVSQILKAVENQYATGRVPMQKVLAAQLQLSELIDEQVNLKNNKQIVQNKLGSLLNRKESFVEVGQEVSLFLPLQIDSKTLTNLALKRNPLMNERTLAVEKARVEVNLARKSYMPDMTFRAGYGQREDSPITGSDRADFFSASVSLTVPLWQKTRQDSKLAAAEKRLVAAQKSVAGFEDSLPHQIDGLLGEIEAMVESYKLLRDVLMVQAGLLAESSDAAYSVGNIEFGTMLSARIGILRYELMAEKYKYQALKIMASLDELTAIPVLRVDSEHSLFPKDPEILENIQ